MVSHEIKDPLFFCAAEKSFCAEKQKRSRGKAAVEEICTANFAESRLRMKVVFALIAASRSKQTGRRTMRTAVIRATLTAAIPIKTAIRRRRPIAAPP